MVVHSAGRCICLKPMLTCRRRAWWAIDDLTQHLRPHGRGGGGEAGMPQYRGDDEAAVRQSYLNTEKMKRRSAEELAQPRKDKVKRSRWRNGSQSGKVSRVDGGQCITKNDMKEKLPLKLNWIILLSTISVNLFNNIQMLCKNKLNM